MVIFYSRFIYDILGDINDKKRYNCKQVDRNE